MLSAIALGDGAMALEHACFLVAEVVLDIGVEKAEQGIGFRSIRVWALRQLLQPVGETEDLPMLLVDAGIVG